MFPTVFTRRPSCMIMLASRSHNLPFERPTSPLCRRRVAVVLPLVESLLKHGASQPIAGQRLDVCMRNEEELSHCDAVEDSLLKVFIPARDEKILRRRVLEKSTECFIFPFSKSFPFKMKKKKTFLLLLQRGQTRTNYKYQDD